MWNKIKSFFAPTREQKLERFAKRIANMYTQTDERRFVYDQVRAMGGEDAAATLIKRFLYKTQNSTYDSQEKELVSDMLVSMGKDAVEPLKTYLRKQDKDFNWPFKTLRLLINDEEFNAFVLELLETIGPDYVRDPERKEILILSASGTDDPQIAKAMLTYLEDDNETIRFVTAEAVLAMPFEFAQPSLEKCLENEDSERVKNHILNGFIQNEWHVQSKSDQLKENIPSQFQINEHGEIIKK